MAGPGGERDAARADLARLLAACYYEPGAEFAEERVFESIVAAATRVDPALAGPARRLGEAFAAARLEDLLVDYTRLFLGPVKALAQPYGSVWLETDGGLMQGSTVALTALYAEGGFEIAQEFRDLPDHVAAELEFLYLLLFKLAQARMSGESEGASTADALRRRFLPGHLGAWVGPFAAAVRAGAQTDFYRALADLTERFVGLEAGA
jgi:TorA maturation chaperone TorD